MKNLKENIGVMVSLIIVIGIIFLAVYFVMNPKEKKDPLDGISKNVVTEKKVESSDGSAENKKEVNNSSSKNMDKISKVGDTLVMNYTGKFTSGKVFDSNVLPEFKHVQPFEFKLGAGQVIKGWDEGLVGMKIGDKKTLTVPPDKGYGPNDYNGIPGNSTLIFDVELVDIK